MDAFAELLAALLRDAGLPASSIYRGTRFQEVLPGYFRATKQWDVLAVHRGQLVAAVELKSQTGPSFGNNLNNRVEEALGSAADFWTAYREEAFGKAPRPWLGYVFAFEEAAASSRPVRVLEPHFRVSEEFRGATYAERAQLLCERLVLERHYDSAWFLLMQRTGAFREPSPMLSGSGFAASLQAHVSSMR